MRRYSYALAITATLGVGLAACSSPTDSGGGGGGGGSGPTSGGHVTVALQEAPDALDPTVARTYVGRIVFINMCEKLFDINGKLEIVPELAASLPKISGDGKTYTIKLRDGIKFNDGTPFNADAVKTTLDRYMNNPKSARADSLSAVDSVTVKDPSTIELKLSEPYAPLTSILAARAGMILSPAQLKKLGDDFAKHPVCVGPFAFDSRPSDDLIELKKSQNYYDKDKVKLDRLTFKVVTQPNVRAANLKSGDIQVADRLAPPDVASMQNDPQVQLLPATSLGYQAITINVSNSNGAGKSPHKTVDTPLAQHEKLRQAFALSLDRDAINKAVWQGQYVPDCTPISPESPFYPEGFTCPEQDIAKAKQLVAETGVKTPVKVTMMVQAANNQATKLGQVVQSMTKDAGFDVKVQPTEFTTALDQAQAGKFEVFQVGWSGRLDPDQNIAPFWSPDSTLAYSGADYDDVNTLLSQARDTTDQAQRKAIYKQVVEAFLQHDNIIYLYHPKNVLGLSKNLTGVEYFGDTLIRFKNAALTG